MKTFLTTLLVLVGLKLNAALVIVPWTQFQNTNQPTPSDLFAMAVTNQVPATNKNIKYSDLLNAISNGLPQEVGFALFETLTNGVRIALSTNQNWVSGVTGMLSGTTVVLGVDIFSITNGLGGGGGSALFNPTQFLPDGTMTNIKSGAFFTNASHWGITNEGSVTLTPRPILADDFVDFGTSAHITNITTVTRSLVLSNVQEGVQWLYIKALPGALVTFTGIDATNWTHTFVPEVPTNGSWTKVLVERNNSTTNLTIAGTEMLLSGAGGITLHTNYVAVPPIVTVSNTVTGGSGFAAYETLTNGVRVALSTNVYWDTGVTGYVNGTELHLGTYPLGLAFQTNQFTTNLADVANNIQTPVRGALWLSSTNSPANLTNGPRSGLEWWPFQKALRAGHVSDNVSVFGGIITVSSNFWDRTNMGALSVAFGSNTMAGGFRSSVLGGNANFIPTNVQDSAIVGGAFNYYQGFATNCFIGGGTNHNFGIGTLNSSVVGGENAVVGAGSRWGFVGGGYQQRLGEAAGFDAQTIGGGYFNRADSNYVTIAGGHNNLVYGEAGSVGGGEDNQARGRWNTIAGGKFNKLGAAASIADSGFIGGGASNSLATTGGGGRGGVIAGGDRNLVGNMRYGSILGGLLNQISDFCHYGAIMGGVSNIINNTNAFIIGSFMTNNSSPSIEIGYFDTNKMRIDHQFTRMVNMGTLYMSNTVAWVPTAAQIGLGGYWVGNSNGNLVTIYTLDGTTTAMKVLAP